MSDGDSASAADEVLDMVGVGFGPASLAIAVALEDWLESSGQAHLGHASRPKVAFLEKQPSFNWHIGMLIHGAKMQISFLKDLATGRDPGSRYTFLNYLKEHNRLRDFALLNTFLPSRLEFSDYMQWAARQFAGSVRYDHQVLRIRPVAKNKRKVSHFEIEACKTSSGKVVTVSAKQVVIGIGGSPAIPAMFQFTHSSIIHSSQYMTSIDQVLPNPEKAYRIAIVGAGQSAVEVFDDLATRLPNAYTTLISRDSALRPSDDSPFVNEIFDPAAVDTFFQKPPVDRSRVLQRNKSTNYSVVRLELLEKMYGDLYLQDIQQPDSTQHQRKLVLSTEIVDVKVASQKSQISLTLRNLNSNLKETLQFDAVILATGYRRKAHLDMLQECESLKASQGAGWEIRRDYSLELNRDRVENGVGIWLQGCNEETHGLSDSLLSVVATRGGEMVQSIFEKRENNLQPQKLLRAML